jgi:hypothetical protein
MRIKTASLRGMVLATLGVLMGCPNSITLYSPKAYEQATSLKVEALTLMDRATEPCTKHKAAIAALKIDLEKAYEYAKGLTKNEVTTAQWAIIKDPARNSLGGFLRRWEEKSSLDSTFIQEAKSLVADGFDAVIELESGKRKPGTAKE